MMNRDASRLSPGITSRRTGAGLLRGVDPDDGDYPERYRVPPTHCR